MNEISPQGETTAWAVREGKVEIMTLTPASFGVESVPLDSVGILGGSAEERAGWLHRVLDGEKIPLRNFLVVNAAAALWVAGKAENLPEAATLAQSLIDSGAAKAKLEEYVAATQSAAGAKKRPRSPQWGMGSSVLHEIPLTWGYHIVPGGCGMHGALTMKLTQFLCPRFLCSGVP